jgi:transcriptional regulator with XRE-family HTH domain
VPAPVTPDELQARLAARIRELAKAKGMTLGGLAGAAGVSRTHLFNVLGGRFVPTIAWVAKIAVPLGVVPHELFKPPRR